MEVDHLKFELKEQVRQKDMYKYLSEQKDEALKDFPVLQAELERAQNEASTVKQEHVVLVKKVMVFEINNERLSVTTNAANSQVQEKIDLIDQLKAEMNEVKSSTEELRRKLYLLASEGDATKEDLASAKDQLRLMKDKAYKWSRQNDELRAKLDTAFTEWDALGREYTALKSKLETASNESSKVQDMLAQYKNNVEVAEARIITKDEHLKWLLWRKTLEEIHAWGFDLVAEIKEAKRSRPKRDTSPRVRPASYAPVKTRREMP
ncbi:uncharacterized protein [Nicotiana tomentosiformis]|uniref:uncharacterized protein n=1 Tax=Nicotiana tomentosiformis TaxID=4098 RepID=UPI00388C850C